MSATVSPSTSRRLVAAWTAFAVCNVVLMYLMPGEETVPFHFVWISLALVYGFTTWRTGWMVAALVGVGLTTGLVLAHHAWIGVIPWEETTEEPLMAGIFGVMVWHVYRRQVLIREVERMNEVERRRHETQQLIVRLVSHELRTPITVARGYTELARAASRDPAMIEDTDIVLEELDKLSRITQRLVTLMVVDDPQPVRECDVDAELLRIVRRWQPTAQRTWVLRCDVGTGHLNAERFEAAMDCLLENAVKFTEAMERIEIVGTRDAAGWTVSVTDDGRGIEVDQAESLLTGPPGRGTETGTGLGLAIVRAVVEALGGRFTMTGAPGRGTTVSVWVPHLTPQPTAPRAHPGSAVVEYAAGGPAYLAVAAAGRPGGSTDEQAQSAQ